MGNSLVHALTLLTAKPHMIVILTMFNEFGNYGVVVSTDAICSCLRHPAIITLDWLPATDGNAFNFMRWRLHKRQHFYEVASRRRPG